MLRDYAEPPSWDELEGKPLLLNYTVRPGSDLARVFQRIEEDLTHAPHREFLEEDVLVEVEPDTNTPLQSFGPTSLEDALHTIERDLHAMQAAAARDRRAHELTVRLAGLPEEGAGNEAQSQEPRRIATLVFTHTYEPPREGSLSTDRLLHPKM